MAENKTHSKVGASSMYRIIECPGSVRECEGMPNTTSEAAAQGTDAHQLAELCLTNKRPTDSYLGDVMDLGNEVDEDMAEAVQVYVDFVESLVEKGDELLIEEPFHLVKLHDDMYGTNDACVYKPKTKTLHVIDYKHGKGKVVEVTHNLQLSYYGIGALLRKPLPIEAIKLHIVQPRAFHEDGPIRTEIITPIELMDRADELLQAVLASEDPNAPLKAGDHCQFCAAAGKCPELKTQVLKIAQKDFEPIQDDIPVDPNELADSLKAIESFVSDWVSSVRSLAYTVACNGQRIPGYKIVEKRAQRAWKDDEDTTRKSVLTNFRFLKKADITKESLISPAQVEALVKKQFPARKKEDKVKRAKQLEKLEELYEKKSSGTKLVADTEPGDEVPASNPAADFDLIE